MGWIEGGTFLMGSEDFYPEERPVHLVSVEGFWIDEHLATVAEFLLFEASGGGGIAMLRATEPASDLVRQ